MAIGHPPSNLHVLVVAGSDSSGGAGLSRDIETIAAFGLRAALAVTAVTVQTHRRVFSVQSMPPALIASQMRAALEANEVGAIKIGMLGTRGAVEAVTEALQSYAHAPVVLDPVLLSSSGGTLLDKEGIAALRHILPLCRIVTPNWQELAVLAGAEPAGNEEEALRQGETLLATGCGALLIKGGHAPDSGKSTDILLRSAKAPLRFDAPRIGAEMRGTGCMLATGIAASLAKGVVLEKSVNAAKERVFEMLAGAAQRA